MSYASPELLRPYMGIDTTSDDVMLRSLLERAQVAIDSYCGRTFEALADATRYYTVGVDTEGRTLYLDNDLCSITSVVTDADGSSPVTLTTTHYTTIPRNTTPYNAIVLRSSCSYDWTYTTDPTNGIEITGKWAWSTSAPKDIVHACLRLAAYYYRQKDAGVFDTTAIPEAGIIQVPQGIPRDVQMILAPYRRNF